MWNERLLNAVKTSRVGLGLLGGCAKVFKEKVSGAKTDRAELAKLLRRIEPGDVLMSPAWTGWRARAETCSTSSLRSPISLREHYPKQVESPCLAPKSIRNCLRT